MGTEWKRRNDMWRGVRGYEEWIKQICCFCQSPYMYVQGKAGKRHVIGAEAGKLVPLDHKEFYVPYWVLLSYSKIFIRQM